MKITTEMVETAGKMGFFEGITVEGVRCILEEGQVRKVPAGGFFFQQEDEADHAYLLLDGQVKLYQLTPEGQQVTMNIIGSWTVFGVISITKQARYPASAEVMAAAWALSWDRASLEKLVERYPRLAMNAMREMGERVREFQGYIRTLSTERVERRLARVLLRLANQAGRKTEAGVLIDLAVSRQDLAEMSGTTLFTVSRILSQWERDGLVESGRERVVIRKPHGLVVVAEDLLER